MASKFQKSSDSMASKNTKMRQNHLNESMPLEKLSFGWLVGTHAMHFISKFKKEIASERGFALDHSTFCRWVQECGPEIGVF